MKIKEIVWDVSDVYEKYPEGKIHSFKESVSEMEYLIIIDLKEDSEHRYETFMRPHYNDTTMKHQTGGYHTLDEAKSHVADVHNKFVNDVIKLYTE